MGENLIITRRNGNRVPIESRHTATKVVSASQNWALNAEDTVQMSVESPFPQHYEIGDQITVFGRDYKLNRLPKVKKTGMHDFQYDLQFEGIQYDLFRITYDLTIDTTTNKLQDVSGDTLTGNLKIFMDVLIANANRVFPGKWVLGACPETIGDKTLTFGESDNCLSVLQNLCGQFNVEFDIEKIGGVYTINMKERIGQTLPYSFKYGKGNGLYELHRDNVSSANIVTRLKVYGSTENITMKYRADRLCLPGCNKGQSFIEHPEAVARYGVFEGRKNFDDIKPTHTGKVTSVVADNVLQFVDTTFPFNLEEKEADGKTTKFLIPGSNAKIHFNTGNLAGYEFEVKKYDHATHTFTLLKMTDERGNEFPSKVSPAFQFAKDNEYKILGIAYPPEIERAAERKLAEEAEKYYQQNSQPKVQYGLSVTKMFLEKLIDANGQGIVNVFAPGDFLHVIDNDIDVDKAIRIKSFTRNVLDPYEYTLTISDIQTTASITNRVISDLTEIDKVIEMNQLKDPTRARANWRSSREVLNMVFDPDGDYYTDKIKPQSIDTMALSVGAKSMQFGLRNTVFQPNFNGNKNVVKYQGGVLTHYTINEEKAMSWALADGTFTATNDKDAFYIYAKCSKKDTSGTIVFSLLQHKTDEDANDYYFFIGVLNSVDPELKARAIALTYGFTMVNGRFIKTGRIESADGNTYFDLDNSEIGGRIVFTSNGKQKTLEELGAETLANKDYIANTLPGILNGLEQQIDGKIETWFTKVDPSLQWKTAEERKAHVGDLWYNTETKESKRYSMSYSWEIIQDKDAQKALQDASNAQDTADGKRRVFTEPKKPKAGYPATPYDKGDLWTDGINLWVCVSGSPAGVVSAPNDWVLATEYTGDENLNKFINDSFTPTINDIMNQLDGVIETWFGDGDPTIDAQWKTQEEKEKHLGDLYYDNTTGVGWRYSKLSSGTCQWMQVRDSGVTEALAAAQQAKDTADGKRRVFVAQPYPPYDKGDLWTDGIDLKVCKVARQSGLFASVDWELATNYTDDSSLNDFVDGVFKETVNGLKDQIDGKVECFYTTTDPSQDWRTEQEAQAHVGDLWFNTSANTLWRWDYLNPTQRWKWVQVKDADAIAAAEAASNAQDTADGKRRVFVSTPYTPYDVGDLWTNGRDLFRCNNSRESGNYVASDWGKATNYTNDDALNNFINTTYEQQLDLLRHQIDGKVESWFQVTDPANYWTSEEEKNQHVGDMWYHTQWNRLFYYNESYQWSEIENQDALDAYDAASQAWDTADGKRRVFVDTPYPPYDIGDLWVDGKELRRCCEPKDEYGSYNVNDWCLAVTYDNTKTVIDGGLVTSGTIQVAGDNHSILAGMTGQGTTADSVRFWAGAAYENRKSAPYRVMQDGSVVMTKATVEGIIKAISGTIGGFEIAPGRIGVADTKPGTSNYDGLAILSDFIKFSKTQPNEKIWSGIGLNVLPASTGIPCMARFEYEDGYSYGRNAVALMARCRPNYKSPWYIQRAFDYDGNVYGIGNRALFEEGYIGTAYTSIVEDNLALAHNFLFTGCNVGRLRFELPTKATIDKEVGNKVVMFEINLVCDRTMPNAIVVTSRDGANLYGYNGQYIAQWEMRCGDSLRLMYYNGGYNIMDDSR